jgi:hypothetical protein
MGFLTFRDPRPAIRARMRSQGWLMFKGYDLEADNFDAVIRTIQGCFDEFRARLARMAVPADEILLDQVMRFEQNAALLIGVEVKDWVKAWRKSWEDEYTMVITRDCAIETVTAIITNLGNNLKDKIKDHKLVDLNNKAESGVIIHVETLIEDLLIRLPLLIRGWA